MRHFIQDASGHTTIEFDEFDSVQLKEANDRFMELVKDKGKLAGTRKAGEKDYTKIKSPSQQQDETLFADQYQGG